MITMSFTLGTFDMIFEKARYTAIYTLEDVKFEFNGVHFVVDAQSQLPKPSEVQSYVRESQGKVVTLQEQENVLF